MCTSPLFRLEVSEDIIAPHHVKFWRNGGIIRSSEELLLPFISYYYYAVDEIPLKQIPCGQCMDCRIKSSKEWAQRCLCEQSTSVRGCYFITLTYNDDCIIDTIIPTLSRRTGEVGYFSNLNKSHLQKFLKDLREYWRYYYNCDNIRFFACGEYGGQTGRAHFHIILFNIDIPDLQYKTVVGAHGTKKYLTSSIIEKLWKKGFITIGEVTADSASYVAGYCTKKLKGLSEKLYQNSVKKYNSENPDFQIVPQNPEFINMSRKPGIGREFYELHKDFFYQSDEIAFPKLIAKPCSYFDKLYDLEQPVLLEVIKNHRHFKAGIKQMNTLVGMTPEQASEFINNQNLLKDKKIKSRIARGL